MKKFWLLFLLLSITISLNAQKKCTINYPKIVRRTFQIDVSPFKDSFNPSICPFGDEYILTFRYRPELATRPWISYVGIMRLDSTFTRISDPELLDVRKGKTLIPSQSEDARVFCYKDEIYIIYNDACDIENPSRNQRREMYIAKVLFEEGHFSVEDPIKIIHKDNYYIQNWEKNWTPFVYGDSLLMCYSLVPNQILDVNWLAEECKPLFISSPKVNWQWGSVRGGTPAQLVDGEYLAFFHSSLSLYSNVSSDQPRYHYFMGAYMFSSQPPFKITKISSEPINGENFYTRSSQPLRVIYPGGYVISGENIYIAYGKDDHQIWIGEVNKKTLMKSLKPIEKRVTRHGRNS
jgi:predicted GH43/DUF377 family glycosyl hydrolase